MTGLVSCCGNAAKRGGLAAEDVTALDELAVKLICLDSGFAAPLRETGRVLGERIATEQAYGLLTRLRQLAGWGLLKPLEVPAGCAAGSREVGRVSRAVPQIEAI
jgi:hypothetical protein